MMNVLNRLSLAQKFLVLGLMVLVVSAVPSYFYVRQALQDSAVARREQMGLAPLIAQQKVVQLMQQHRGLSAGMLSGNEAMAQRRVAVQDKLNRAFEAADQMLRGAEAAPQTLERWHRLHQRWTALAQGVGQSEMSAPESTQRHTALIGEVLKSSGELMGEYGLSQDGHNDTREWIQAVFVSAPWLAEKLGVMRALGSGFLTQHQLPAQGKGLLMALRDRVRELHAEEQSHLQQALGGTSEGPVLGASAQALAAQVDATLQLADRELIDASEWTLPATEYFDAFTRTIDAVYQFNSDALGGLTRALTERAAQRQSALWWMAGAQLSVSILAVALALALVRSITQPLKAAVRLAQAVSDGDLSVACDTGARHEMGQLMQALEQMRRRLGELVSTVRADAQGVAAASSQIAQGNTDLSARTEATASALEQTAAAMGELRSHVKQTDSHAQDANRLVARTQGIAAQGGEVVGQVVETMHGIAQASERIGEIIGVIDGIAFQTNILALNAAVEAARAGEQGRGFAVVASEVRMLAQRSAEAARQVKGLVEESVKRTEQGSALVDRAGSTMAEIVAAVGDVAALMGKISSASASENLGISQVGEAIEQMDQSTQQNAAMVEEMAAAANGLSEQARQLVHAVAVFKLSGLTAQRWALENRVLA